MTSTEPSVVLRVGPQLLALPAMQVEQLVALPAVAVVPGLPRHCRGVMNLRGQLVPVRDLRLLLGMPARIEELTAMNLPQRRQDHINWVAELRASVVENRPFKLTTDPHGCAFGRWYDHFEAEDPWLKSALAQFDEPHQRLHATAAAVTAKVGQGDQAGALALVERLEAGELAELRRLFEDTIRVVEKIFRESVVVLRHGAGLVAFTADEVLAVDALAEADQIVELGLGAEALAVVQGLRLWGTPPRMVLALDIRPGSPLLS
jgi:purine-binding chemotaxis protein CheW